MATVEDQWGYIKICPHLYEFWNTFSVSLSLSLTQTHLTLFFRFKHSRYILGNPGSLAHVTGWTVVAINTCTISISITELHYLGYLYFIKKSEIFTCSNPTAQVKCSFYLTFPLKLFVLHLWQTGANLKMWHVSTKRFMSPTEPKWIKKRLWFLSLRLTKLSLSDKMTLYRPFTKYIFAMHCYLAALEMSIVKGPQLQAYLIQDTLLSRLAVSKVLVIGATWRTKDNWHSKMKNMFREAIFVCWLLQTTPPQPVLYVLRHHAKIITLLVQCYSKNGSAH